MVRDSGNVMILNKPFGQKKLDQELDNTITNLSDIELNLEGAPQIEVNFDANNTRQIAQLHTAVVRKQPPVKNNKMQEIMEEAKNDDNISSVSSKSDAS